MSTQLAPRRRIRQPGTRIVVWLGLAVILLWTLAPIATMVFTSFKPATEIFTVPPTLLPDTWTLDNYVTVFTASSMPEALRNSIVVGLIVALLTLTLGTSAGYALARLQFRGARSISLFILLGQMIPLTVLLLALFQMITAIGFDDTVLGVAFAHLVITLPLVTWMIRNQIVAIPYELEEAAMIDGCSRMDAVLYAVLPVAGPGLAAAGMFAFLQSWHEFVLASVLTRSGQSRTAPIALTEFASEFDVDWGATMAASVVLTVPLVIAFVALQRYLVNGLTGGAVKG